MDHTHWWKYLYIIFTGASWQESFIPGSHNKRCLSINLVLVHTTEDTGIKTA